MARTEANHTAVLGPFVLLIIVYALALDRTAVGSALADDISNWGQVAAAFTASAGCLVGSRRSWGDRRRGWTFLGAGAASWGLGQLAWTIYESILRRPVPFPSAADIGYLLFPVVAGWGLVTWLGLRGKGAARGRDVFDGLIIAGSLLMLSWLTVLGPLARSAGADGWFSLTLSLAYPVGDLVLGTLVLLTLLNVEMEQWRSLWPLAFGLTSIAVADSSFTLLMASSSFSSSDLLSNTGWFAGFLAVAAAGFTAPHPVDRRVDAWPEYNKTASRADTTWRLSVPYLALVVALTALGIHLLRNAGTPDVPILLAGVLVSMVLLRQMLAMLDNQRLIAELSEAHRHLENEATHDPLTGLPNRILFSTRLDCALAARDGVVNLMFCDLDGFKRINDEHGHDVGDELLRTVARRLLDCVGDTDTVARLGGDEFAIILHDCHDPDLAAASILRAVAQDVDLGPAQVAVSVSIGRVAHHNRATEAASRACRRELANALLKHADAAMYAAKSAGRNQSQVAADFKMADRK